MPKRDCSSTRSRLPGNHRPTMRTEHRLEAYAMLCYFTPSRRHFLAARCKLEDVALLYTTDPTVKCFVAWHNNARRKFIMGARLSSKTKFPPQRGILY
jgi:hypothetical protein